MVVVQASLKSLVPPVPLTLLTSFCPPLMPSLPPSLPPALPTPWLPEKFPFLSQAQHHFMLPPLPFSLPSSLQTTICPPCKLHVPPLLPGLVFPLSSSLPAECSAICSSVASAQPSRLSAAGYYNSSLRSTPNSYGCSPALPSHRGVSFLHTLGGPPPRILSQILSLCTGCI